MKKINTFYAILITLIVAVMSFSMVGCTKEPEGPTPPQHEYKLDDDAICYFENDKLYGKATCECGDTGVKEITDYTVVTPETIGDYFKTGQSNRILVLEDGNYDMFEFNSVESFDRNLTIIAKGEEAYVGGILITSGATLFGASTQRDTMPSNLKVIGLKMTQNFHLRNCSMDGITIYDCDFVEGCRVTLSPNAFIIDNADVPVFGSDGSATADKRQSNQINKVTNVRIENCSFTDAKIDDETNQLSKIQIRDADDVTIKSNLINKSGYSAIQLISELIGFGGNLTIEGNTISETVSRALRLNVINADSTLTIKDNVFSDVDTSGNENGEVIMASSVNASVSVIFSGNTIDGEELAQNGEKVIIQYAP